MLSKGELVIEHKIVELMHKKDKLDHSELDSSYFMKKMKNEA